MDVVAEGIESVRQAIQMDSQNVMAHKVLGDALYLAGKESEAEEWRTRVIYLPFP